jgi:hypothetical protein
MNAPDALPQKPQITPELARELAARVKTHDGSAEMLTVMRLEHPGLRFAVCSEEDIPARMPTWLEHDGVSMYLLDATEHCVSLTTNEDRACGLVFTINSDE